MSEGKRLNLPFVGVRTFMRRPYVADWAAIDADVAFMGAPFDLGAQVRTGARLGPMALRDASMLFPPFEGGYYDHDRRKTYLSSAEVRIVDIGDADVIHIDALHGLDSIQTGVRAILAAGALPVVVGGDHSIHAPCIRAFKGRGPIDIIQIDAHLDYADERAGVRDGQGSPMRRAAELPHVRSITHIGIRNQGSSSLADFQAAEHAKSTIITARQFHRIGVAAALNLIPFDGPYYLTIDVDGFDASIAPGTGTPSSGGLLYDEACDLFEGLVERGDVVGIDIAELSPNHDPSGATPLFVAQILTNILGFIFDARKRR